MAKYFYNNYIIIITKVSHQELDKDKIRHVISSISSYPEIASIQILLLIEIYTITLTFSIFHMMPYIILTSEILLRNFL